MGTFTETTASVTVSVEPFPILEESRPDDGVFVFAYSVRIENNSSETIQLIERHWLIESAGEQTGEVSGPGVVGVQPTLSPGEQFEYTSSTVIKDPVGSMRFLHLQTEERRVFYRANSAL
jgi:ApaG protein